MEINDIVLVRMVVTEIRQTKDGVVLQCHPEGQQQFYQSILIPQKEVGVC